MHHPCLVRAEFHTLGENGWKPVFCFSKRFQLCVRMHLCHLSWPVYGAIVPWSSRPTEVGMLELQLMFKWRGIPPGPWALLLGSEMQLFDGNEEWRRLKQRGICPLLKELKESPSWLTGFFQVVMPRVAAGTSQAEFSSYCWVLGGKEGSRVQPWASVSWEVNGGTGSVVGE